MFGKQGGAKANSDFPPKIGGNPGEPKRPDTSAVGTSADLGNAGHGGKFPSTGNNDKNKVK